MFNRKTRARLVHVTALIWLRPNKPLQKVSLACTSGECWTFAHTNFPVLYYCSLVTRGLLCIKNKPAVLDVPLQPYNYTYIWACLQSSVNQNSMVDCTVTWHLHVAEQNSPHLYAWLSYLRVFSSLWVGTTFQYIPRSVAGTIFIDPKDPLLSFCGLSCRHIRRCVHQLEYHSAGLR